MKNKKKLNAFQIDLVKKRYHIFNPNKANSKRYYPEDLLKLIRQRENYNKQFNIEVGEVYTVRAFFAISQPIDDEVEYQSGYLDLKLVMKKNDSYIGEVMTTLPPDFVLQKGSKIKFQKENILYKPDYKSKKMKV